ncbi:DUF1793-domain-containing protein [Schizopora paradoxa]|uniref:DUF1793-domain-containing protein n=1 Tax=Schizopora paradoxa TaxID=27342 RepID=A0A0H2R0U4_9AGAM|nr:DUF1793-domain-containing protein [Schizopora paradoxa]
MYLVLIPFILALLCAQTASSTFIPFLPPALPLAVKGPYLNSWFAGGANEGFLSRTTPSFWPAWDDQTTWTYIIVVDNAPCVFLGDRPPNVAIANQTAASFTATRTSVTFIFGPVEVNVTFLSPITPNDLVRQSMPFAYFYIDIASKDGAAHDIRIYSDVDPRWLHGNEVTLPDPDPKVNANASLINSSDFVGLQMQLQNPQPFTEVAEHAQDVIGVFAVKSYGRKSSPITYQIGDETTVRELGINGTGLQNTTDANYSSHALDSPYDALAISLDLGSIISTSESIMWTIGMIRDPSINLTTASGAKQLRSSYYWSNFSSIPDIVSFALEDFDTARSSADAFDEMIKNVSLSDVSGYTDLLAFAARQIFGNLEITVVEDMGDIASLGTSGGTNVVDVLYAGFPAILYLNPDLGHYLLRPILESQVNNEALVGQPYAPRNLGSQFPNVSSNTSPHNMGIEQSGNMLIMVLAHSQKTGDLSLIQAYYPLLKSWADYLVNATLNAGFQTTSPSDGITSFNQTNLVLKGIIGVSAMSSVSSANNEDGDAAAYQAVAQQYMQVWLSGALSDDHSRLLSSFGDQSSSGLIYNIYADKLLGLGLVPSKITAIQSNFYISLFTATDKALYGVPLDSGNSSLSRLDWTMFSIASCLGDVNDSAPAWLQSSISMLTRYAASPFNNGTLSSPLAIIYNPETSLQYSGINRQALCNGSTFRTIGDGKERRRTSPIIGGIVGGMIALLISFLGIWIWRRNSHVVDAYNSGNGRRRTKRQLLGCRRQGTRVPRTSSIPLDEDETATGTNTLVHQPHFIARREKFAPSHWDSVNSSQPDSSIVFSDTNSSADVPRESTQRLEGRLEDIIFEIQRVREDILHRSAEVNDDSMTEELPSYATGFGSVH